MRREKMVTKKLLIVKQILFDSTLGKYREFYVDNA